MSANLEGLCYGMMEKLLCKCEGVLNGVSLLLWIHF